MQDSNIVLQVVKIENTNRNNTQKNGQHRRNSKKEEDLCIKDI